MPLPAPLAALLTAEAYPHPAADIRLVETHISWVILAGDFAYKLRRPLDLGFVDFRHLARRRQDCLDEVHLNRRTCAGLYLDVLPISSDGQRIRLGGPGEVLDYAVQMRRLPEERMLARLLEAGQASFDMLGRLVWKIVHFHAAAEGGAEIRATGGYATMVANWQRNLGECRPFVGQALDEDQYQRIRGFAGGFADQYRELFLQREEEGRIRDCHGDLRADAVCFHGAAPDGICIFDCLEFDARLRCSDTGLDLAFLAMDLEQRGQREAADIVQSLYTAAAADPTLPLVSSFYRCYRATIRGKVAAIRAAQPELAPGQAAGALAESRRHFALAVRYARPDLAPALVLVMGLSGSGKSLVAGGLAHRVGAALLSTDIIRKELAGLPPARRAPVATGSGLYGRGMNARVYARMTERAERLLAEGHAAILDGTYLTRGLRAPVLELAARMRVPLTVVVCTAPEAVLRERQQHRGVQPWTASDATLEVWLEQQHRYEPPDEVPPAVRLLLDTTRGLAASLDRLEESVLPDPASGAGQHRGH